MSESCWRSEEPTKTSDPCDFAVVEGPFGFPYKQAMRIRRREPYKKGCPAQITSFGHLGMEALKVPTPAQVTSQPYEELLDCGTPVEHLLGSIFGNPFSLNGNLAD